MPFNAGEVQVILGAKVNIAGFQAYDTAMAKAVSAAGKGELAQKRYDAAMAKSQATLHAVGRAATVGAAGGILALGAAIAGSVKKAADFEAQLSSLQSVSSASAKQMDALKKSAMEAGAATKFSALDAAKAQTELAKGGLSVTKILGGGLKGALALAAAGEMDLADAATTTANALNLFGLNGSQSVHVADALATAANTTTADVSDFAMALTQGGAAAKAAGLDFDQTVTFLEAMANAGVKGSDAGTSMKAALTQIANPSKEAAGAMKKLNLEFFDAQGNIKPLPAIAKDLDTAFGGLSKQQRLQAAATIAGTDGMRGLLALYDSSPAALRKLEDGLAKQGTAAEVAAKKQDNLKGKIENLKGSVETAGIALGQRLLPILTQGAESLTTTINRLSADGSIDRFATGLISGGEKAAGILGDIGSAGADVVSDLAPVAGVLADIAGALNLGDATNIEAILAGIAGFKVAGVVAPGLVALASGIKAVAAAGSLAGVAALVNPFTLAAVAAGGLAAGLVILSSRESAEEKAADANAAAHKAQAEAIRSVQDAERAAADKGLAAKQSTLDLKQAQADLNAAREKYGKKSPEYEQALIREQQAALRSTSAHDAYSTSIERETAANKKRIDQARQHIGETNDQVKSAGDNMFVASRTGNANDQAAAAKKLAAARAEQTTAVQAYIQAQARAQVSDASRMRLMNAASQITEKNAQGISHLISAMDGLPKAKQTKILLTGDQNVLATLGGLAGQLTALGRKRTVAKILATADSASAAVLAFKAILAGVPPKKVARVLAETRGKAEVAALKALIDNTNSKDVAIDVTTRYRQIGSPSAGAGQGTGTPGGARRRADGRGPGGSETALVGEGRHAREAIVDPARGMAWMVDRPTVMDLPDTAYVIPEDPMRRGRAMGLLSMLASDLGLEGFVNGHAAKKKAPAKKPAAKGKAAPKAQRALPGNVEPTTLPLEALQTKERDARDALNTTKGKVHDLPGQIRTDEKRIKDTAGRVVKGKGPKAKKARDLKKAREDLAAHRKSLAENKKAELRQRTAWEALRGELAQAKKYQALITRQEQLADIAANQMRTADGKDDQAGYDTAKGNRVAALKELRSLLVRARAALKDQDSQAARELDKSITQGDGDINEAESGEMAVDPAKDPDLTDAQKALIGADDRAISLAALTKGLGDDTVAAGKKVSDVQSILDSLLSGAQPSSDALVTSVADILSTAKQNFEALTSGGPSNTDPDLQAQFDQAKEERRIAREDARINRQALEVFAGSGDIGTGGRNARDAVNTTVVFQSYVPPSPGEAMRLAGYVNGGNDLQGSRGSTRQVVA
jgi:TP901 family phage tail tape measure protein